MPPAKPVPEDAFFGYGTNFETRWERLADVGYTTPNDLFFIRTHTQRANLDPASDAREPTIRRGASPVARSRRQSRPGGGTTAWRLTSTATACPGHSS
jgi:hypothetical protein